MDAHEADAVIDADGGVVVTALPFPAGDRVRVLILHDPAQAAPRHTADEIERSRTLREGLRGTVFRYDRPNDPVGIDDWNMLKGQDEVA